MYYRLLIALVTLIVVVDARREVPLKFHVDIHAKRSTVPDGSRERPFSTLIEAKRYLITERFKDDVVVIVHSGVYAPLSIDHPALSDVSWEGSNESSVPIVSGGIEIPSNRFRMDPETKTYVASLEGLGAENFGEMIGGDCVGDCQHDKVGVSFDGETMTLARWPNAPDDLLSPDAWTNAGNCSTEEGGFDFDIEKHPDVSRLMRWKDEQNAFVHGYWQWDWADCYGSILDVYQKGQQSIHIHYSDTLPPCKTGARWMGVNILSELDFPGEYYIDSINRLLYLLPPKGKSLNTSSSTVKLMYQPGGVLNVTSDVKNVRLSNLDVRDGRHVGVLAQNTVNLQLENLIVHAHGTHGIDATNSTNAIVRASQIFDVGCTGLRATAGDASTLQKGNMDISENNISHYATWKRSYQPGVFWAGVGNIFRRNSVSFGPHNGFLGGGDFGDGVNNIFEANHVADCTFDTIDSGGFYTCGQRGAAFTNRGNVLRGNTFERIRNTAGLGVQVASNQAVYLDDQMSGWVVENNNFFDCQIAMFVGGGRSNLFLNNQCIRCGTVFYLNNQGMFGEFDNPTVNCTDLRPPFETTCSTGAAEWMTSQSPAADVWATTWPEMQTIRSDYLGYPAHTELINSTYCCANDAEICEMLSSNTDISQAESWQVKFEGNMRVVDC